MVTTNSAELWNTMWSLKDHGKSYDAVYHREHPAGFRWLHESFGTNWRLTEIQSAIGRLQLRKLPNWVEKRRENAAILDRVLFRTAWVARDVAPRTYWPRLLQVLCLCASRGASSGMDARPYHRRDKGRGDSVFQRKLQ